MITIRRTIRRESLAAGIYSGGRIRPVIVELTPFLVGLRLKGTRATYYLPIDWCYREALRAEIARQKAERKKQRAEARKARG